MKKTERIFNAFTKECDMYLLDPHGLITATYLMEWDPSIVKDEQHRLFAIRSPGATRGCLYLNRKTMLIDKIKFDEHTSFSDRIGCYKREISKIIPKWIGKELI